jgi:4-hydroxybenzoate polyprenyltransferase
MTGQRRNIVVSMLLLLQAVRWYNVSLIVISQYLIALFVFNHGQFNEHLLNDYRLHFIILSTSFSLAGGFLINGFYDMEKDLVVKPNSVVLLKLLGQDLLLNAYALLTIIALILGLLASVKVFAFVAILIFLFWFYSHKLQKLPLVRELTATLLAIAPLLAVWLHYGIMHHGLFVYLGSLAIVGFTREVVKDLTGHRGNIIFGYITVVVVAGQNFVKRWLVVTNVLLACTFALGFLGFVQNWDYFMVISAFSIGSALLISAACLISTSASFYSIADTLLKVIIVVHLVSLFAVNTVLF